MSQPPKHDPYLWLEDVAGDRALAWVRERNADSETLLQSQPGFDGRCDAASAKCSIRATQIPYVTRRGDWLYNFWRDAGNPRGLWRRTTLAEYRKADTGVGDGARHRRARPRRGRELGLGRRRLPGAGLPALPGRRCRAAAPTPRSCANSTP